MIKSITSSTNQYGLDLKTKTVKTTTLFRIFLLFSFLFSVESLIAQPTITSFAPISGKVGDTVVITGTNFNITSDSNVVFFGATKATVSAATTTSLTVTVPTGATYASITVLNRSTTLATYSVKFFNPIFSPSKGSITAAEIEAKVDFGTSTGPNSVSIGDIDGDGKPDLVIANFNSNTVSVLRNIGSSGSISFATKVDFITGTGPNSLAIGDMNGDGKPDLAIANSSGNTVSVLRNTGSSGMLSFAAKVDFTTGTNPRSIAIGDLDGNGKPDLAITNASSMANSVSVLRNTSNSGTVSFATKIDFATGKYPNSVSIGDIDGDGKPDLAVANYDSNTVSVLRNISSSGSISFATKIDFTSGSNPFSLSIGDIDGDGKLDLAIANYSNIVCGSSISILRNISNSGTISFATIITYLSGSGLTSLAISDMDGDGKPDFAVANRNTNSKSVSVFRNTSSISNVSFEQKVNFFTDAQPNYLAIADLDGDSKPDLAITNQNSNIVSVLRNNPKLTTTIKSFTPLKDTVGATVIITGTNFNTIAANNIVFFGATKATVTAVTATTLTVKVPIGATYSKITVLNTSNSLAAYSNQIFNPIFSPSKGSITSTDLAGQLDFTTNASPSSIVIADLDGDGKLDMAVTNFDNNNVSVFRNTGIFGYANFALKADFPTGFGPHSLAIGDIDGDGKLDLVITNSTNTVSVLRNTSNAGMLNFATKVDFATGSNPISIAIGDMDGDGKPDLAIANRGGSIDPSYTFSALRNTSSFGSISFATKVDYIGANNGRPFSVSMGDINRDGMLDLALTYNYGGFSLFYNTSSNGIIRFAPGVFINIDNSYMISSVAIGDLDGDDRPDLAIANNISSGNVSILRNTGNNCTFSFANKVDFATDSYPKQIAIGDIDGDGKPDLVVVNKGTISNSVSVLRNTSIIDTLNFATKVDFKTSSAPESLAIGDIDGDGKPDLAIVNSNSNTVSVLRNNPPPPLTITSFTPTTGAVGTTVVITGTNFNTSIANNKVFFGATQATVLTATATTLTVTAPLGATYAPITVSNTSTSLAAYSYQFFNPTFNPNKGNITTADISAKVDFTTGTNPRLLAIGDLNGDGKSDLVTLNSNYTISVLQNTSSSGTVNFATKVDFTSTHITPRSIIIGDINGDGKPDLLVANYDRISIFLNTNSNGLLSFAGKVDFFLKPVNDVIDGIKLLSIGDLDGDGKLDLAIVSSFWNSILVMRNTSSNGNLNFAKIISIGTISSALQVSSLVIGDIDKDGKPDIATIADSNFVYIFRNMSIPGSMSFAPKVNFPTGAGPNSLAIGDLDGDGKPDLTITNRYSNSVSILRNSSNIGTISFATKVDFITGSNPQSSAIGDIDGDGKPDLATTNFDNVISISVLRNTSIINAINFTNKVDFITGTETISFVIGDIDGDGKADLANTNLVANTVSIFRNNPQFPPTIITSNSLTTFNSCVGKASIQQSFILSGVGLTANVVVTAPTSFEVSTSSVSGFSSSVSLSPISSVLNNTVIYVRLTSSATGSPNGNVVCTSTGAPNKNIAVSGVVNAVSHTTSTNNISICPSALPYTWNGRSYNTNRTDTIYLVNSLGCDSVTILKLAVKSTSTSTNIVNICPSALPYTWNSRTYNSNSIDTVYLSNSVGCDSITILKLTVKPISISTNIVNLCPSALPYTWNSRTYNSSITDTVYLSNSFGCDSITILKLTVKQTSISTNIVNICPSALPYTWNGRTYNSNRTDTVYLINSLGCDSITILKLSVKATSTSTNNISICPTSLPFIWNGRTYNANTTDTFYLTNSVGCDSITILKLTIKPTSASTSILSICPSALPYTWNSRTYNSTRTDTIYLTNSVGCDSISILKLTIKPTSASTSIISICPSALPYTWNGRTYNSNRTDTVYLTNSVGCDSITILKLTVKPISTSTNNISICPSLLPFIWNGRTYNSNRTDTVYLINSVGCDSLAILKLTVKPTSASTSVISICPSALPYTWNNRTYNTAKIDTIYSTNSAGCDSLAILKLTVKQVSASINNLSICSSALPYTWNGLIFNAAGTQTKTGFTNSVGCDSSATLDLTVKSTSTSTNSISICPNALPYIWNGLIFNAAGTQTKTGLTNSLGCDSSATLNLTVNAIPSTSNIIGLTNVARLDTASYSVTGTSGSVFNWVTTKGLVQTGTNTNQIQVKWNAIGMDTLKVTETSNQGCVGSQKTLLVNIGPATGINEINTSNGILVYPNPFNETIFISLLNNSGLNKAILFDLLGKEVLTTHKSEIDVKELKSGVYLIMVIDNNGNSYSQKLIKN